MLSTNKFITVYDNGIKYIVFINEILMMQSDSNYSTITTTKRKIFTSKTLKHWLEKIHNKAFVRVHTSFVININHIDRFDQINKVIYLNQGIQAKVSRRKLKSLSSKLTSLEYIAE